MQSEEFGVAAVEIVEGKLRPMHLLVEHLSQARAGVQERKKPRRIEPAAVSQSSSDQVVVVRRDRLQDVQQRDGIFQHLVGAAKQAPSIGEIAFYNQIVSALQFERRALHQKLRTLVDDLECQLILVQQFFPLLL